MTLEFIGWCIVGLTVALAVTWGQLAWMWRKTDAKVSQALGLLQEWTLEPDTGCKFPDIGNLRVAMQQAHDEELATFNTLMEKIEQLQSDMALRLPIEL